MATAKVVVEEMDCQHVLVVFNFFAVSVRLAGKAAVAHAKGRAIGLSPRGNAFPRFLKSKAMADAIGAQLTGKLMQPIKFQYTAPGAPPILTHGYNVTLLIDVCKAILAAEPHLDRQQKHTVTQAKVILSASAKAGIQGLVYALAGYDPTAAEVIAAFKMYVQEEAKKYEKEFPSELYDQWYRLYDLPVLTNGRPWYFKHFTERHIYRPLAQSNGKILELTRALKAKDGDRKKKLFQFLPEIGTRALRMQLGRVLEMAESSKSKEEYESKIVERFGGQPQFDLEGTSGNLISPGRAVKSVNHAPCRGA